ncbi:MAG: 3-isopropylmalate dehydratase small subunit [Candidatus Omnitrophica bacterium]|nr:3-isopropylmalate dehydratase small subunit [Candidatus Omnitrophota bacterium]
MLPITTHTGIAAPLDRKNIDTDLIIPKQFLKKTERAGFGKHLFHEIRYTDYAGTQENPDFVLNQPAFRGATILLAQENFGCGSSREHAPWALADYGFRVIIAPSFADIFYNNCSKTGILLVRLSQTDVNDLICQIQERPGSLLTADLSNQTISAQSGKTLRFEINPFIKDCLLKGLDQIGWTMQFAEAIKAFEKKLITQQPWLG